MGCWELFDLKDLPEDANLIGAKWVLKLKYKNAFSPTALYVAYNTPGNGPHCFVPLV